MGEPRKIWPWGVRVLVLAENAAMMLVAVRVGNLPVGVPFEREGKGWAVLDVVKVAASG